MTQRHRYVLRLYEQPFDDMYRAASLGQFNHLAIIILGSRPPAAVQIGVIGCCPNGGEVNVIAAYLQ